ncbi:MAG: glycosyltransferase family 39 protein [Deltaproteobacteria bacterium]|nr:glycosyltransferase family 39 protein [Deltaproteobacteria bacterium]
MKVSTILFIGIFLILFIIPGIDHGTWRPDEPRVAGICAEMALSGDIVVPRLNGRPFLEKPPLYFIAGSLAGRLFGTDNDVPYRMVSLIFGILTLWITFSLSSRNGTVPEGLMAAGILASSWQFFQMARWIQIDSALVCFIALAMFSFQRLLRDNRMADAFVFGLSIGLSFLVKGFVGPAIIAAAVLIESIRLKNILLVLRLRPAVVSATLLVPVTAWILSLYLQGGWPFVREVIVINNVMRFLGLSQGAVLGHQHGILYYFDHFPRDFLPWTFVFIPAFISSIRNFRKDTYISWFIGPFILLCISSTKRGIYLVPLFPAAACMTAAWLNRLPGMKWERVMLAITRMIAVIACFLPFAGIFLGYPLLGSCAGIISAGCLIFVWRKRSLLPAAPSALVILMSMALFASAAVYYQYMKPSEDYLGFTREALVQADGEDISIVYGDEMFEGLIPMLTGKHVATFEAATDTFRGGLYLWETSRRKLYNPFPEGSRIDIILERDMGSQKAVLARVFSGAGPGREN